MLHQNQILYCNIIGCWAILNNCYLSFWTLMFLAHYWREASSKWCRARETTFYLSFLYETFYLFIIWNLWISTRYAQNRRNTLCWIFLIWYDQKCLFLLAGYRRRYAINSSLVMAKWILVAFNHTKYLLTKFKLITFHKCNEPFCPQKFYLVNDDIKDLPPWWVNILLFWTVLQLIRSNTCIYLP